jgi:hypothetical protein
MYKTRSFPMNIVRKIVQDGHTVTMRELNAYDEFYIKDDLGGTINLPFPTRAYASRGFYIVNGGSLSCSLSCPGGGFIGDNDTTSVGPASVAMVVAYPMESGKWRWALR